MGNVGMRGRIGRRVVATVVLLSLVLLAVGTAWVWPRDDEVGEPDVVIVLGGAGQERVDLGIRLVANKGINLVLSSSAVDFGRKAGLRCDVFVRCLAPIPENTAGEARGMAVLAEEEGWDQIVVVTTDFHTSRARLLFRQCLGDQVAVVGAEPRDRAITPWNWLREMAGGLAGLTFRRAC